MLPGEHARQRSAADSAAADEDLAQQPAQSLLLGQSALELGLREQALLDEESPERAPGKVGLVHVGVIGWPGAVE